MSATLQGLATVHTSNAGPLLEEEFHAFQDHNLSSWYLAVSALRWFGFWLDFVCVLFVAVVVYSFLMLEDSKRTVNSFDFDRYPTALGKFINFSQILGIELKSGKVGLAILCSLDFIESCQWGMRQSAALETHMTSVERIVEYTELSSEPSLESDAKHAPPAEWPQYGNIEFRSLNLRYDKNGPRSLRNLTFRIEAKVRMPN